MQPAMLTSDDDYGVRPTSGVEISVSDDDHPKLAAAVEGMDDTASTEDDVAGEALLNVADSDQDDVDSTAEAEAVLANRAGVRVVNWGRSSALVAAVVNGKPNLAQLLEDHGAVWPDDTGDQVGEALFCVADAHGEDDAVSTAKAALLLARDSTVAAVTWKQSAAAKTAAAAGKPQLVLILVKNGAEMPEEFDADQNKSDNASDRTVDLASILPSPPQKGATLRPPGQESDDSDEDDEDEDGGEEDEDDDNDEDEQADEGSGAGPAVFPAGRHQEHAADSKDESGSEYSDSDSDSDSDDSSSSDEDSDSEGDYDEDDVGIPMMLGSIGRQGNLPVKKESFTRRSGTLLEPLIEEEEEDEKVERDERDERDGDDEDDEEDNDKDEDKEHVQKLEGHGSQLANSIADGDSGDGAGGVATGEHGRDEVEAEDEGKRVGPSRHREQDGYNAAVALMQVQKFREEEAAITIQALFRGYVSRKQVRLEKFNNDVAATKVQALYRGYKARVGLTRDTYNGPHPKGSRARLRHQQHAVKIIQKYFRGYLVRKRNEKRGLATVKMKDFGLNPGKGRPTWPCGHRRIAYDGSILPDPCKMEKVKAWKEGWQAGQKQKKNWGNFRQVPETRRGKGKEVLQPLRKLKMAKGPKMQGRGVRQYQNSYLETYGSKTYDERDAMNANLDSTLTTNPELTPFCAGDIAPEAYTLAQEQVWGAPEVLPPVVAHAEDRSLPVGKNYNRAARKAGGIMTRPSPATSRSGHGHASGGRADANASSDLVPASWDMPGVNPSARYSRGGGGGGEGGSSGGPAPAPPQFGDRLSWGKKEVKSHGYHRNPPPARDARYEYSHQGRSAGSSGYGPPTNRSRGNGRGVVSHSKPPKYLPSFARY